uniref:Uncharacterized protein n=1 Tax=CrAss-like virus sp. ctYsL76 TaxID=2826826 RepID=A0A8S5QLK7_9CAUD|nr:MAG TPA: hypothetical protein [CrAss-like virus sp. ctYsL76]
MKNLKTHIFKRTLLKIDLIILMFGIMLLVYYQLKH